MCWEGGSIYASLSSMKSLWITRAEYNEHRDVLLKKIV
jgi:actin-related protein